MAASDPERMMEQYYSLEGNDLLEQEALLEWLRFLQAEAATEAEYAEMATKNYTECAAELMVVSTQPGLEEEEEINACSPSSSIIHKSAAAAIAPQMAISSHLSPSPRHHHHHTFAAAHEKKLAANRCRDVVMDGPDVLKPPAATSDLQIMADSSSAYTPQLTPFQSIPQRLCLIAPSFARNKLQPLKVGYNRHNQPGDSAAWKDVIDQGLIAAEPANATLKIADEFEQKENQKRSNAAAQTEPNKIDKTADEFTQKENHEKRNAAQTITLREQQAEKESISKPALSSSQLIETRFIRPTSTPQSNPVHEFPKSSQYSSASNSPFSASGYKDRLKDSFDKPILRGVLCRKGLFSKRIYADDLANASNWQAAARTEKRARIEDYVDPVLLSEACRKLRCRSRHKHAKSTHSNYAWLQESAGSAAPERSSSTFDWPSEELQAMTLSAGAECKSWYWRAEDSDSAKNYNTGFYWPSAELQAMTAAVIPEESHDFSHAQLQNWHNW